MLTELLCCILLHRWGTKPEIVTIQCHGPHNLGYIIVDFHIAHVFPNQILVKLLIAHIRPVPRGENRNQADEVDTPHHDFSHFDKLLLTVYHVEYLVLASLENSHRADNCAQCEDWPHIEMRLREMEMKIGGDLTKTE